MKKLRNTITIIIVSILIFFMSVLIGILLPKKTVTSKKKEVEEEKNNIIKEEGEQENKSIKCEYIGIEINASNKNIETYMKKYDEHTYILSIKNSEVFEEVNNKLNIKFKNSGDSKINKDTFNQYNCAVLLVYVRDKNKLGIQSISTNKEKITIKFCNDEIKETIEKRQAFCILISKLDSKEVIDIAY